LTTTAATGKPHNQGEALLEWLRGRRLEGFERSFKLSDGRVLTDRFLAGIHKADITPAALFSLCEQMGMPARVLPAFKDHAQDANAFHFGYEGDGSHGLCKFYLEYASRLGAGDGDRVGMEKPVLLHLAYKWDVSVPGKVAIARYECHPGLAADAILAKLAEHFPDESGTRSVDSPLEAVRAVVELAARRASEPMMYLEVSEDNNPRASFDIKMHDAALRITEIEPWLRALGRHLKVPVRSLEQVLASTGGNTISHLSGGINREGRGFLTVYYSSEAP
jgi:hypothetical protein